MRMDRYDEESVDNIKKSRTDKNQELYTDVYLNNAYVDISEISEVVNDEEENPEVKKKVVPEFVPYTYKEKNYDVNELINEAIESNTDNLRRSLEQTTEIDSIIRTINENQLKQEQNNNLLESLMPDSDTTTIMEPLGEAITNTKYYDTSVLHKNEMSNEILNEIKEDEKTSKINELKTNIKEEVAKIDNEGKEKKEEPVAEIEEEQDVDESLKDETKLNTKVIFIIIGVVILIIIILIILISKKIIKI